LSQAEKREKLDDRIIYLLQSVLVFLGIQKTKTLGKRKRKKREGIFGHLLCHHSSSWFGYNLRVFYGVLAAIWDAARAALKRHQWPSA